MKKVAVAMLSLGLLMGSCAAAMAAEPEISYNGSRLRCTSLLLCRMDVHCWRCVILRSDGCGCAVG